MSLNITGKYITVWNVEDKGNYIQANLSTGKKNKEGTYTNMSWRTRFVGKAKEKAKWLKDKDKIEIINGIVENTYDKEKKTTYVNVTVFDYHATQKEDSNGFVPVGDEEEFLPF
jgi:hypothetical protein